MNKSLIEDFKKHLSYDKDTGLLTRKLGQWAGHVQQSKDAKGYVMTSVSGKSYRAHRVIWMMFYEEDAPQVIDHINGVKDDNRISNLRAATPSQNSANRLKNPEKKTKLPKGVQKTRGRYMAYVYAKNRRITYGKTFATPLEAAAAYDELAIRHHGEFAQTNKMLNGGNHGAL